MLRSKRAASRVSQQLDEAVAALRDRVGEIAPQAVVLGSGLGSFVARLSDSVTVGYAELPHWPRVGVVGHTGHVVSGTVAGKRVLALSGRAHLYEGHSPTVAAFPVRVLARAGVKVLILTNAAGGLNPAWPPGTLMAIDDHINLTGTNPLVGPNDDALGPRFPDMSDLYSRRLRAIADAAAHAMGLSLQHGVYAGVLGPSYETPAEIRAFGVLGANAVGMSTVVEAIAAKHMGVEVLGLSCIANPAAGLGSEPLDGDDVVAVAHRVQDSFARLVEGIVARL
jgi:purine-nucleoside phosphorylase